MNIDDIKCRVIINRIEDNPTLIKKDVLYYNKIYNKIKKGENPYIIFEDNTNFFYHETVKTYYMYKRGKEAVTISREEILKKLGIYLRKIKLEKICSKI
jgi:hypothetical protein